MATADWLLVPAGIDPIARVAGWIAAGAVWPLLGLAFVLKGCDFLLQKLFRAAIHGEFVHRDPLGMRTTRTLRRIMPSLRLAAVLPAFDPHEVYGYKLVDHSLVGYGQHLLVMTTDTLAEEGLFRGLPLAVALWMGGFEVVLVGLGTLLWAVLHGTGRGIALLLTSGWLLAGLWLAGHGELAVGLHLGFNLVFFTTIRMHQRLVR